MDKWIDKSHRHTKQDGLCFVKQIKGTVDVIAKFKLDYNKCEI